MLLTAENFEDRDAVMVLIRSGNLDKGGKWLTVLRGRVTSAEEERAGVRAEYG